MKKEKTQSLSDGISLKINPFLVGLDKEKHDDRQKMLELCQLGKCVSTYFNDFEITKMQESPDFIISNGIKEIGVEHQRIVDSTSKAIEGFYENISRKVELELEKNTSLPNFLINIYLKPNISTKSVDKPKIVTSLTNLISHYVFTGILLENDFIEDAFVMPDSQKSIAPNFGAYFQKEITKDLIIEFVAKKEVKLSKYRFNSVSTQWLFLVIGSLGKSSFEMNEQLDLKLDTGFDKVFIYEDFKNKLFELK